MAEEQGLIVFQNQGIRREKHKGEWYFSIIDIIKALTKSNNPRNYWSMLKKRELETGIQLSTDCVQLKLKAPDEKLRLTDCANTKSIFRIIQSIPSKRAEPLKQWLAQIGYERVQEIENPELGQDRIKEYYELKGYNKEWIDKRLRSISVRQSLTEEWSNRGIHNQQDFSILTNEISKATFGINIKDHKKLKHIEDQNLRDNMTDLELIFNMLGEA